MGPMMNAPEGPGVWTDERGRFGHAEGWQRPFGILWLVMPLLFYTKTEMFYLL